MSKPTLNFFVALLAPATLVACGGAAQAELPVSPPAPSSDGHALALPADAPRSPVKPMQTTAAITLPAATLSVGEASPPPAALPTTRFVAPTPSQLIAADKASALVVKLDVKNWVTQTGASHVHLILDNRPYKALFDLKTPVTLGELAGGPLSEGEHTLVAFPSRMNHESVKTKGALSTVSFFVGKKGLSTFDAKKGSLIFSRPKGEYKGDAANHILVDFQLLNIDLAPGKHAVRVTVEGASLQTALTQTVNSFGAPLFLSNLSSGKYSIKAELLAPDGTVATGSWNSTMREFAVNREATVDAAPAVQSAPATGTPTLRPMPPAHDVLPTPGKPVPPSPSEMQMKPSAAVQTR